MYKEPMANFMLNFDQILGKNEAMQKTKKLF